MQCKRNEGKKMRNGQQQCEATASYPEIGRLEMADAAGVAPTIELRGSDVCWSHKHRVVLRNHPLQHRPDTYLFRRGHQHTIKQQRGRVHHHARATHTVEAKIIRRRRELRGQLLLSTKVGGGLSLQGDADAQNGQQLQHKRDVLLQGCTEGRKCGGARCA